MGVRKLLGIIPAWVASTLCLAAILWLTLAPDPTGEIPVPLFPGADKLVHAIMFGGFSLCLCFDMSKKGSGFRKLSVAQLYLAAIISGLTGIIIEFLQREMGLGRSFEAADMISDVAGAAVVSLIFGLCQSIKKKSD